MSIARAAGRSFVPSCSLTLLALVLASQASVAQTPPQARPAPGASEKSGQPSSPTLRENEARHPLDPLSPDEIRVAVATVRELKKLPASFRFVTVTLNEPPKALVLHPRTDEPVGSGGVPGPAG